MVDTGLLPWADRQAPWVRGALKQQLDAPQYNLSAEIIARLADHILAITRSETALPYPDSDALSANDLRLTSPDAKQIQFCSIQPGKNVNKLDAGQTLTFSQAGLTVVYGQNGSGKSGYCRIIKKVCKSRTAEEILPDVYTADEKARPAALVRYIQKGDAAPTEFNWDGIEERAELAQIATFDAKTASLYVDKENKFNYLPIEISLLEAHAALRRSIGEAYNLRARLIAQRYSSPLSANYSAASAAGKIVQSLYVGGTRPLPSKESISDLCSQIERQKESLKEITSKLDADPLVAADRSARIQVHLQALSEKAATLLDHLSDTAIDALKNKVSLMSSTNDTATIAAWTIPSVPMGFALNDPWMQMYTYAIQYIGSLTGNYPDRIPEHLGQLCPLCQTPFNEDATGRIKVFNAYVSNEAIKAANQAASQVSEAYGRLRELKIPTADELALSLSEYKGPDSPNEAKFDQILAFFEGCQRRLDVLQSGNPTTVAPLQDALSLFQLEIAECEANKVAFRKLAMDDAARRELETQRDELQDTVALADRLDDVLLRLKELAEHEQLKAAVRLVDTTAVSSQITDMRKSRVMEGLLHRLKEEQSRLRLGHIAISLTSRSAQGESFVSVMLNSLIPAVNSDILSEGEQRTLALASFLAEIESNPVHHAVVMDDPVSSLDYVRTGLIAKRLVELAQSRQVTVFTHNIAFLFDLAGEADLANPKVPVQVHYLAQNAAGQFGCVSAQAPWFAASVGNRIESLRTRWAAWGEPDTLDTELWRQKVVTFCADLRVILERIVESELLNKVVERFNADVRTKSLAGVDVSDEDYSFINRWMSKLSEWSGHDRSGNKGPATMTLREMDEAMVAVTDFSTELRRRKKALQVRRDMKPQPSVI